MGLINKFKIKSPFGKRRQIRLFDIPIIEYGRKQNNKITIKIFPLCKKLKNSETVVYLKVNAVKYYSLSCIQHWLNITEALGYDYYILCDKAEVRKRIEKEVFFPNGNIKFIKSNKSLKQIILTRKFTDKNWFNAGLAHLTTFCHSKKIKAKYFWNIDADDTAFLVNSQKVAKILTEVENYAKKFDISIFSLDMWSSWSKGKHWSFGVSYTSNKLEWQKIFINADKNWWNFFCNYHLDVKNLDWFFTYLKDFHKMNIQTFYVDNMRFIHFCDFGGRRKDAGMYYWKDKYIHYPLYEYVLKDNTIGKLTIPDEIIKITSNATEEECINFYKTQIRGKK